MNISSETKKTKIFNTLYEENYFNKQTFTDRKLVLQSATEQKKSDSHYKFNVNIVAHKKRVFQTEKMIKNSLVSYRHRAFFIYLSFHEPLTCQARQIEHESFS